MASVMPSASEYINQQECVVAGLLYSYLHNKGTRRELEKGREGDTERKRRRKKMIVRVSSLACGNHVNNSQRLDVDRV